MNYAYLKDERLFYDGDLTFHLQDKNHDFLLGLGTILRCLNIAESKNYSPKLPSEWWDKLDLLYANICCNIPHTSIVECEFCDQPLSYIMQDSCEFHFGFFAMIKCLGLAEKNEYIPQLPAYFWKALSNRYNLTVDCRFYL